MRLPAAFNALANYDFRLFFTGQVISQTGSWMQRVAQAWLVLELTDSPLALGTVTAVQFLPILVLSLFAGALADRLPKQRFLAAIQAVMVAEALVMAFLVYADIVQLWHIYALGLLHGIASAMEQPARHAFPYEIVGRALMPNAVALNSVNFNTARIVGPSLGGVAVVAMGIGGTFLLTSVSHVAALATIAAMTAGRKAIGQGALQGTFLSQLAEVLRYVARTPSVAFTLGMITCMSIFGHNYSTVLPLLARYELGLGASGFGFLMSAVGGGAVLAALTIAQSGRSSRQILVAAQIGFAAVLAAVGLSPGFEVSLVLLVVLGLFGTSFSVSSNTNLQMETPERMRGRIMGLYSLLFAGMTPVGATVTGGLADAWGIRPTLEFEALMCLSGVVGGLLYLRSQEGRQTARRRLA